MDEDQDNNTSSVAKKHMPTKNVTPSKSESKVKEVTPKGADVVDTPMKRHGFRYSVVNFEFEALLYTTICADELLFKLESYNFQWEGST